MADVLDTEEDDLEVDVPEYAEEDRLVIYRVAMIEELGFSHEDSVKLAAATKLVSEIVVSGFRHHDVPISWHDVDKLLQAGATKDQVLRIIL